MSFLKDLSAVADGKKVSVVEIPEVGLKAINDIFQEALTEDEKNYRNSKRVVDTLTKIKDSLKAKDPSLTEAQLEAAATAVFDLKVKETKSK